MEIYRRLAVCLVAIVLSSYLPVAKAGFLMSSSELVYEKGPIIAAHQRLAAKLATLLNDKVTLHLPPNWQKYTKTILGEDYDIYFAAEHVTAYALPYQNAIHPYLVGSFAGERQNLVLTKTSSNINSIKDVDHKRLCTRTQNSLGRVQAANTFTNPVMPPIIVEVRGKLKPILPLLMSDKCDVAIVAKREYASLNAAAQKQLRIVHSFNPAPNISILLSHRLTKEQQEMLRDYFVSAAFATEFGDLFEFYVSDNQAANKVIPIDEEAHAEFDILIGNSWGW